MVPLLQETEILLEEKILRIQQKRGNRRNSAWVSFDHYTQRKDNLKPNNELNNRLPLIVVSSADNFFHSWPQQNGMFLSHDPSETERYSRAMLLTNCAVMEPGTSTRGG